MVKQIKSGSNHRKGAVVVLAACSLVMVMAFLAFSIDLGHIVVTQSELQNAADSAALSGARALLTGRDAAIRSAQYWASKQSAAGQAVTTIATEDVQLGLWDDNAASFTVLPIDSGESPNAVRVTCRRQASRGNELKLFFASVIGTKYADLSATATAAIQRDRCGVIVGLDYVDVRNGKIDSFDSKLGTYAKQSPTRNGDVCSDGPISLGPQGFIYGDAAPGNGYTVNAPAQVSGNTKPRVSKIGWKPVDPTTVIANNLNNTIPKKLLSNGRLRLTGDTTLQLKPGNYYFPNGIDMSGTSSIAISGPTHIVMGGTSSLSGTGIVNNTQIASNLRIDVVNGSAAFSGNIALYADIYAPTANLNVDGSAGFYGAMFGKSVLLSGSASSVHGDEALRREYDETTRSILKQ